MPSPSAILFIEEVPSPMDRSSLAFLFDNPRTRLRSWALGLVCWGVLLLHMPPALQAQQMQQKASARSEASQKPLVLSVEKAIEVALASNHALQSRRLQVQQSRTRRQEARGGLIPHVSLSSSYQRNIRSPNPFAGTPANRMLGSLGAVDWLAYNEQVRTDGDPSTQPLPQGAYRERLAEGYQAAGGTPSSAGDNPFAIDNQIRGGLRITQTLYDGRTFALLRGARRMEAISRKQVERQRQQLIHQVRRAYYDAQLAEARAQVVAKSVRRATRTVEEAQEQLAQGVASKYHRLNAEVEQSNLETRLLQARNQAEVARGNLKLTMGVPITRPIRMQGSLELTGEEKTLVEKGGGALRQISLKDASQQAFEERPDLQRAQLAVELRKAKESTAQAAYAPKLAAFAQLGYAGYLPDDRSRLAGVPGEPFTFEQQALGLFDGDYWTPQLAVGVRLRWSLFDGFQTAARSQRAEVAVQRARVQQEGLRRAVHLAVEQALRNLRTARRRIASQQQTVQQAELNYTFARRRLEEGVGSPLEERKASELLDQSRLSYLRAVHDYLVAKSAFEVATGTVSTSDPSLQLVRTP